MNLVVENYVVFPTLIKCVHSFLTQDQCDDIIKYARSKEFKPHMSLTNGSMSTHRKYMKVIEDLSVDVKSCLGVKDKLHDVIRSYSEETGINFREVTTSWINFQTENSQLLKHSHPLSCVSGALYLNVDDDSSKIYFYNPNPFVEFTSWAEGTTTQYSHKAIWFKPNNGDLLLFPSWLSHGSDGDVNMTKDRAVLSFNTFL